eukprot:790811-Rhodomonas_salina.1
MASYWPKFMLKRKASLGGPRARTVTSVACTKGVVLATAATVVCVGLVWTVPSPTLHPVSMTGASPPLLGLLVIPRDAQPSDPHPVRRSHFPLVKSSFYTAHICALHHGTLL